MGILPGRGARGVLRLPRRGAMAPPEAASRLTTTQFRRPVLADAVCNAKAGCLYPNNARMLAEARDKGYDNALVADALGNVAETGSANVFMVRDGTAFTPIPNGTFLNGITRQRHIANLRAAGVEVVETVLTFDDFRQADEVFMTGNLNKVTPVVEFDGTHYQRGPIAKRPAISTGTGRTATRAESEGGTVHLEDCVARVLRADCAPGREQSMRKFLVVLDDTRECLNAMRFRSHARGQHPAAVSRSCR
jgi:hypothetical protein